MSEQTATATPAASTDDRKPRARRSTKTQTPSRRSAVDAAPLREWLASLDLPVKPVVHINGYAFTSAVLTVDFGSPLKPVKLAYEQSQELMDRMRKLTKEIIGREVNVRISHDGPNGVYWASVG